MKKLGLKPLGDLRGKFGMGWLFIGLIMAFCVSACSDDDDTVAPVFPAKQTINCNVGETKQLSFDTNTSWQLISSATWCRFVVDGEDEYSLSGGAGNQNITIKVTDEAQKNDGISIAQLTLIMGDGRSTIADVVRSAEGYELKIYDVDGQEISQIEVGYDDYISFKVKANFRFAATNRPDWIEVAGGSIVGAVNKEITGKVKIIQNGQVEKYPVAASNQNVITFADEDGKAFFSFPVVYKGMKPDAIVLTMPSTNVWNWVVTLDGKNYMQTATNGTSGATTSLFYKNGLPFTVKALNDEYNFVYIEKGLDWQGNPQFWFDYTDWMKVVVDPKDKGKARVVVDPYILEPGMPTERTGYVFAFSRAKYNSFNGDFTSLIENGDIAYAYQTNLIIEFTQKEVKEEDSNKVFEIVSTHWETLNQKVPCAEYTGSGASYFKEKYGVETIYEVTQPTLSMNVNTFFTVARYASYGFEDEKEIFGLLEPAAGEDLGIINAYIGDVQKDIFLVFYDSADKGKMLIIRVNN